MSIRLYLGVPGSGKTQAIADFIAADDSNLFLLVDRAGDFAAHDRNGHENPRWRGAPPRLWAAPPPPLRKDGLRALEVARAQGGAVRFGYPWEALEVAQLARDLGDCVYVDDEIDFTATYRAWEESPLRLFAHRGRHLPDAHGVVREVHVLGAARRPQSIHIDLTSLADEVTIFRVQGSATLDRCVKEGWLTQEETTLAQTLANGDFLLWRSDGTRARGHQTNPFPAL